MDYAAAARDEPRICPFLHAVTADGALGIPIRLPDEANRCTALGDAAPQSLRQQEYACLASAHVNCPRFVRGVDLMAEPAPLTGARVQLTPAIVGALLVLAASFALSVGFVVANGGMNLPAAPAGSPQSAVATVAPSQAASPASSPSPVGEASAAPSAEASIETATSSLAPSPPPAPSAAASPKPSSDRYTLLKPCSDVPDCWIYTVRKGDNLVSIARYFGVPFEIVTELNPWTRTKQLVAGEELRLPPPTR